MPERIRIAVIDDQRDIADTLVELLEMDGFEARAGYNGEEAVELVAGFRPEIILFDIAMPGLDGLELARRLRSMHGDDIVLLAMTGNVEDARATDTFVVVDHYFSKPFEMDELLRILRPGR